ncbi:MAG TPA: hypothetical protein VF582_03430 [Allosphingosinicella sp.]|jgi:hypothetical protein
MRKVAFFILLAAAPISAASAQNMPLNQFLARATALEKKGPMALFSSDMGRLKKEMQNSGLALRDERRAAVRAGSKPAFCPPAKQAGFSPREILGHFRSIPASQRARMTTKDGFRSLLANRYPCR